MILRPQEQQVVPETQGQLIFMGPHRQSVVLEQHGSNGSRTIWAIRGSRATRAISGSGDTWAIRGSRTTWDSNGSRTNQRQPTWAIIVGFSRAYLKWQPEVL
jgi:hypothetical protein